MSEVVTLGLVPEERHLPSATPDALDWLRRRLDLPAVIRSEWDEFDPPGLKGILAIDDVDGDRWLIRAYLRAGNEAPLFLARIGVEHLGHEPDDLDSWRPPHNARPVTATVMRGSGSTPFGEARRIISPALTG